LTYKENADLIDGFEITLNTLKQEKPRILQSLSKISVHFNQLKLIADDILDNNVNFSPETREQQLNNMRQMLVLKQKLDRKISQMFEDLDKVDLQRNEVVKRKFSDPAFVSEQFNFMLDVVAERKKCTKKFASLKHKLKLLRDEYGDMNAEQTQAVIEARVAKTEQDVKDLEEAKDNDEATEIVLIEQLACLKRKLQSLQHLVDESGNLRVCALDKLVEILQRQKELNEDLLRLEKEVAMEEIELQQQRLGGLGSIIEPLLVQLNESKWRVPEDDQAVLDKVKLLYVKIKTDLDAAVASAAELYAQPSFDAWERMRSVQKLQALSAKLKNHYLDCQMIQKRLEHIPVPLVRKFADVVDQMIFDFKEQKKIDIFIQKLSPNNYLFGTKRIYAKVVNEKLLVRVGGGFMDIDGFYLNYGQDEYFKWQRLQEKQRQAQEEPSSFKHSKTLLMKKQTIRSPKQSDASTKNSESNKRTGFSLYTQGADPQLHISTESSAYLTDQSRV